MDFHEWAVSVAADTAGISDHPRTMGTAGQGELFGWGRSDFDLSTGTVPFKIAQRHYYASDQSPYLMTQPQNWSEMDNKPLFWGELGNNQNGQPTRWYYAEDQIKKLGRAGDMFHDAHRYPRIPERERSAPEDWPSIVIPVDYEIVPALGPLVTC